MVGYNHEDEVERLKENVEFLHLRLVGTFDNNGTQAILLENDTYVFLGFRGTEPTSIKDIRTDAKADIMECGTGGEIHSRFNNAFNDVYLDIASTLDNEHKTDHLL